MQFSNVTIRDLMNVGAHFGHKKSFWDPRMLPYIYGTSENNTHIIDLQKTVPMFREALQFICRIASQGGRILFVGTKMQASEIVADEARRCSQYFINHRWLGGTLTNWKSISSLVAKLSTYQNRLQSGGDMYTKKELLDTSKKLTKLKRGIDGISEMGGIPDLLFVVDVKKEHIAVKEASALKIPIVGIVDTNSNPRDIDYPIPGNDDSTKSIQYYCRMVSDAVLKGIEIELSNTQRNTKDNRRENKNDS